MPQYTVVIPVLNDPGGITTTLRSLPLDDARLEVVVIDNGSDDDTPVVLAEFETHPAVTVMHEPREHSQFAARNRAIAATTAEYYVFIDADMWVTSGWLDEMDHALQSSGARYAAVGVELAMPARPTLFDRYDHHTGFPIGRYIATKQFAPTCSLIIHHSVFAEIGLFDARLHSGGDVEFGKRAVAAGIEITHLPQVMTHHPTRSTLRAHLHKAVRVGRGHAQMRRRHPGMFAGPANLPRPGWVNHPPGDVPDRTRLLFTILTILLTAVRGWGFAREWLASKRSTPAGRVAGDDGGD
jgi:GT2 family glycosyltransferase